MSALTERIEAVAYAKSVSPQAVTDALIAACKRSIHKAYGADLDVEIGFADGVLEAFVFKDVIPDDQSITNPHRQVHLSAARKEDPETTLEDEYGVPISVESLARKALEPGQLERIFDRHRNGCKPKPKEKRTAEPQNIECPTVDIGGTVSAPALPPRPPVEIVKKGNDYVEVPYKDTRRREQKIADLHRELEEWKRSLIANFAAKIEEHAAALREMIEEQVT